MESRIIPQILMVMRDTTGTACSRVYRWCMGCGGQSPLFSELGVDRHISCLGAWVCRMIAQSCHCDGFITFEVHQV